MKTRSIFLTGLILFLASAIVFTGCRKRNDDSTLSASNHSLAENMWDDVYKQIDEAASQENELGKTGDGTFDMVTSNGCATVTVSPVGNNWPKTLTIDFGTTNCQGTDGRMRRGKVIAEFTGPYRDEGTTYTVTLDGYHVNDNHVQGSQVVTNEGRNSNNQLYFTIIVSNASITTEEGVIEWESNRVRTWVEGESTTWWTDGIDGICDDVYEITGTASGTNLNGNTFNVEVIEPLRVQLCCRWITAGVLDVNPQNLATRTVDYGDGTCDAAATVTVNGNTYNFTMQ